MSVLESSLLDGSSDDPTRPILIESILDIIAMKTPTEMMKREVGVLSETKSILASSGLSSMFQNLEEDFGNVVVRYANLKCSLSASTNRLFAVELLRNAQLSSDTMKYYIFQFPLKITSEGEKKIYFNLTQIDLDTIVHMHTTNSWNVERHVKPTLTSLKRHWHQYDTKRKSNSVFSLEVSESLFWVLIDEDSLFIHMTLLRRRNGSLGVDIRNPYRMD